MVRGAALVRHVAFAIPGDLQAATGGYGYDRRMARELRELGWQVDVVELGDGFPQPSATQRAFAMDRLRALPEGRTILIDGLAFGVLPELRAALSGRHALIALVHHPLALESGLPANAARVLHASEKAALATASGIVVTSPQTARDLAGQYDVPESRIAICRPGTDRVRQQRTAGGAVVRLLSVGSVVPRKGHDVLVEALAGLTGLPWHLTIVGDRNRDAATARALDALIAHHGLEQRIAVTGELPEAAVHAAYAKADLFVLASHHEGYGMAFAEAIAHELPVIGTTAGAIPETVAPGAGLLVPPGDVAALRAALHRLIGNDDARQRLAEGAEKAAVALPSWAESALLFSGALEAAQ